MRMETQYRVNAPTVTHETIDEESVIVNLGTGNYYSLQGSGAEIWALVERNLSVSSILQCLVLRYQINRQEIEENVLRLLGQLEDEGLIVAGMERPAGTPREIKSAVGVAFEPPVLQKFTDMQELLLLDPIHEVDSAGWPHRKMDGVI